MFDCIRTLKQAHKLTVDLSHVTWLPTAYLRDPHHSSH